MIWNQSVLWWFVITQKTIQKKENVSDKQSVSDRQTNKQIVLDKKTVSEKKINIVCQTNKSTKCV